MAYDSAKIMFVYMLVIHFMVSYFLSVFSNVITECPGQPLQNSMVALLYFHSMPPAVFKPSTDMPSETEEMREERRCL